jgi:hypothetical protein
LFRGLHLSDLTFTEEGNPDFVTDEVTKEEIINFPKHMVRGSQVFVNFLLEEGRREKRKGGVAGREEERE